MKFILSLTLFILVSTFSLSLVFASNEERITINTYYPSPQGSYLNMEIGRRLVLGNDGKSAGRDFVNQSITGFNDGIEATDAAIFVPVWRSPLESDLRLYILDDPDDKFSIWGNTCGNAGRCNDINAATNVATFQADGKVAFGLGINYNNPLDTALVVSNNGNDTDWDNATQLAISRYNSKQFALQLGYAYVSGSYAGGRIQAVDNGSPRSLLLNPIGGEVGIGTTSPTTALDVNGGVRFRNLSSTAPAAGNIVYSMDNTGNLAWRSPTLTCRETGLGDTVYDSAYIHIYSPPCNNDEVAVSMIVECTGVPGSHNRAAVTVFHPETFSPSGQPKSWKAECSKIEEGNTWIGGRARSVCCRF